MNNDSKSDFIVSQADAEIIAHLFNEGVSDFQSIIDALEWTEEKNKQLFDFAFDYFDFSDFDDDNDYNPIIPEENYRSFIHNLPIDFSDDWFDEEWYEEVYQELRDFMIEIDETRQEKGKMNYSLDDVIYLIGMTFCPITQKPKHLVKEIQSLVCVSLRKANKKTFIFDEVLDAFDKAFENYIE